MCHMMSLLKHLMMISVSAVGQYSLLQETENLDMGMMLVALKHVGTIVKLKITLS